MSIYYALGNALVSNDEIRARKGESKFQDFQRGLVGRAGNKKLDFRYGTATTGSVLRSFQPDTGKPIGFKPIGIGKPLTVQIRHIYTGDKAQGFWGTKDMLVTSAMKSISTYDAAPRAVNFLVPKAKSNRNFRAVAATDKGTPLVHYSPVLAQSSSVVTVEVMFSSFPKEAFDAVSQAFSAAAGVPVFAPASGYLVAAGIVTKLLGNVGKSLFNGTPALRRTEEITFVTPGSLAPIAHFVLLIADDAPTSILRDYKVNGKGELAMVGDESRLYDGEYPYAVISLDGRENDDYKSFAPTAASAAQLEKFYNISDGSSQPLSALIDAFRLYNDMSFRSKALSAAGKLKGMDERTEEFKQQLAEYNSFVKNIGNEELKPPPREGERVALAGASASLRYRAVGKSPRRQKLSESSGRGVRGRH